MGVWEFAAALLIALAGGTAGASVIGGVNERRLYRLRRQEELEDRAELKTLQNTEERLEAIEQKTDRQSEALKFILYDRIRYLGQAYIAEGEIDFDDRRILSDMHHSYHYGLGGNGDLDTLMEAVNRLPLKTR